MTQSTGVKQRLLALLPGLPVVGLVVLARALGLFQAVEWQALDMGLRSRPLESPDSRITIVSITEEDIRAIGDYPIPDEKLTALLTQIDRYSPSAIGLDIFRDLPAGDGYEDFTALVEQLDNLFVIDKIVPPTIAPPTAAPEERIGFVDAILDGDGFLRRSLLGANDIQENYRFSFTLLLAQQYLAERGLTLENGLRDPAAMRFDQTELSPLQPSTGGYVNADVGGHQILVNFRRSPFDVIDYQSVMASETPAERLTTLFENRIVLVGVTAPSIKDTVNTAAIEGVNPGLVTGVEVQAHAVSQILSAVLDGRSLLRGLPDWLEIAWIVGWGLLGAWLAGRNVKPAYYFGVIVVVSGVIVGISYGLLLSSWWMPVVPAVMAFVFNGMVLYPSYRIQQGLRLRLEDRQQLIERTFDQIHNGPLQKLATVLSRAADEPGVPVEMTQELNALNQELRGIYVSLKQEFLSAEDALQLGSDRIIRLDQPLHEILYEVYEYTLQRTEFPYFESIKFRIRKFEPMAEQNLNRDLKRDLGRFLEESLCNAGKYAKGCTRLSVICMQEGTENVIRVVDNGLAANEPSVRVGRGTAQAKQLAKKLKGHFARTQCEPKGTCSELKWMA